MPARLKLTVHAQTRLLERGIDIGHVKSAVLNPDSTEDTYDGKKKASKDLGDGRTIEVVYTKEDFRGAHDFLIITAYYL